MFCALMIPSRASLHSQVVTERGRNRVEYDIKVKPNFSSQLIANDVVIKIPVPENSAAKAKHIKARYGKTKVNF